MQVCKFVVVHQPKTNIWKIGNIVQGFEDSGVLRILSRTGFIFPPQSIIFPGTKIKGRFMEKEFANYFKKFGNTAPVEFCLFIPMQSSQRKY